MILYFLRHGLAEERMEWKEDDALRPLTDKGKNQMERQARRIVDLGLNLEIILTSPLARARQTAEIAARYMHLNERCIQDARLAPGFNLFQLQAILRDYPHLERIMFVGHEPDFSETISALIGGGRLVCKKGGLARVDVFLKDPLQGELVWLTPPKTMLL